MTKIIKNKIEMILLIQLVVFFFVPPIPFKNNLIFLADVWNLIWFFPVLYVVFFDMKLKQRKENYFWLSASLLVFLLSFINGNFRGDSLSILTTEFHLDSSQYSAFQPLKEFVNAVRFWVWIVSAWALFHLFKGSNRTAKILENIKKYFLVCLVTFMVLCFLEKIFPGFKEPYYLFYKSNPHYLDWKSRVYGLFRSPMEAATVLGCGYFLLLNSKKNLFLSSLFSALLFVTLLFTKTASVLVPFSVGIVWYFYQKIRRKYRPYVFLGFSLFFTGLFFAFKSNSEVQLKLIDFMYRFKPWGIYQNILISKWNTFFFGLGFSSLHVDSGYLFILTRCGVVGMVFFLYNLIKIIREQWRFWAPELKALMLMVLLANISIDLFIFRSFVYVMICLGIPAFALNSQKSLLYKKR